MSSKKRSLARRRSGYLASPYFAWSKRHGGSLRGLRGLHGTSMPTWAKEWKPKDLLGVGAAGAGAAAARFFAAPGTFLSRHAGLIGALAGLLIGGVTKNARSGLTGALAGLSFEALEYATDAKIASGV